jgi:hypothetical protein
LNCGPAYSRYGCLDDIDVVFQQLDIETENWITIKETKTHYEMVRYIEDEYKIITKDKYDEYIAKNEILLNEEIVTG